MTNETGSRRERLATERERIRAEEAARIEREQQERQAREDRYRVDSYHSLQAAENNLQAMIDVARANQNPSEGVLEMVKPGAMLKLGDIVAAIAPLSITADGLAQLGFVPAATDKAAKLYRASDLYDIFCSMLEVINRQAHQVRPEYQFAA